MVFPAQAGVILRLSAKELADIGFPRASGCDPYKYICDVGQR